LVQAADPVMKKAQYTERGPVPQAAMLIVPQG
jgi:hypothetical protein